jgi:hypothetical protein
MSCAEEEPDAVFDVDDEVDQGIGLDENTTDADVGRYLLAQGPEPRTGGLVAEDEKVIDADDAHLAAYDERMARDAGIDGGGATAEEAAVHLVDHDADVRSSAP